MDDFKIIEKAPCFAICKDGNIYRIYDNDGKFLDIPRKMKASIHKKSGYLRINVNYNNKNVYLTLHSLVAQAFIPNPNNKFFIKHKNSIKIDNRVENLEWEGRESIDLVGKKFGRWTVLKLTLETKQETFWECQCDCGTIKPKVRQYDGLLNGVSQSCGCLNAEISSRKAKGKPRIKKEGYSRYLKKLEIQKAKLRKSRTKNCIRCNKEFVAPRDNVEKKYCSMQCYNQAEITQKRKDLLRKLSAERKGKPVSPETREKISIGIRKAYQNPTHREKMMGVLARSRFLGKTVDIGQRELIDKWNKLGFNFIINYQLHREDGYLYYLDGYDEQRNIVLEYDSAYHREARQILKDKIRQDRIISMINPKKFWRYDAVSKTWREVVQEKETCAN